MEIMTWFLALRQVLWGYPAKSNTSSAMFGERCQVVRTEAGALKPQTIVGGSQIEWVKRRASIKKSDQAKPVLSSPFPRRFPCLISQYFTHTHTDCRRLLLGDRLEERLLNREAQPAAILMVNRSLCTVLLTSLLGLATNWTIQQ